MYSLQYEAVTASNYLPFFRLHGCTSGILNWQSTPHAATPLEVVLKLKQTAFILQLAICSMGGQLLREVEVWTASGENYVTTTFQEAARLSNVGETDSVANIGKTCRLVKLVIREKTEGKPIGISTVRMIGQSSTSNTQMEEMIPRRVDKLLLDLGVSADQSDYQKDLEIMDIDEESKITIRDISRLEPGLIEKQNFDELESLRSDIKEVIKIGKLIIEAERNLDWASAKENYKDMKMYAEQLRQLRQRRDRYDKIYETSRFEKMVELHVGSDEYDHMYNSLLEEDQQAIKQNKQRIDDDINYKRMLVHNEYQQIRSENPPWWERDTPHLDDLEMEDKGDIVLEEEPPKPKPKPKAKPVLKKEPKVEEKKVEPKKVEPKKPEKYDFSNPYVFNEGDVDLEKYMGSQLSGAALKPDNNILRKYEDLEYLKVLGSKVWLSINSENWRQRESSAQSVLEYTEADLSERYRGGNTAKLFLSLLEFAHICCHDKVLTIYMLGLRILSTCLKPPICAGNVTSQILNKGIKEFVPILMQKVEESNSKAREISQGTLLSIFKHPSADPYLLHKEILKGLKEQTHKQKIVSADKLPARVASARMEVSLAMLDEIDIKNKNVNTKELFDLLAGPCLLHSNYEVRITAIELVGELYRFIGEPILKMVTDLPDLRPGISDMVCARLKKIKQSVGKGKEDAP